MAGKMSLATRNTKGVIASLRQYGERAKERAKVVVEESADRVYQTARQNAPVDTGFMVEHLRREFTPAGLGYSVGFRAEDFAAAGKDFYPVFLEFGTRFMAARPFLFPAAALERPRFRRELVEALRTR